MIFVSVIIPTYNRLSWLQQAVASVQAQNFIGYELIVVDDGSEDDTWEWLTKSQSSKLKVYRQKNQGPSQARNFGVTKASGQWIAFLDSDDQWLPEKLGAQVEFLKAHPQYKICQTEEIWIRNGVRVNPKRRHRKHSGNIFEQCLLLCIISPSAVMIERQFFLDLGGFDPALPVCEDYDLWLRASLRTPIATMPEALTIKYGGHADQLSRQKWGMDRFRVQAMEKVLAKEVLTAQQRRALLAELQNKLKILAAGHQKRHADQLNPYQERLSWLQQ